jgi:hypothetical protein
MALNIDIVNSTVINVYETGEVPRSYFGVLGASGRFYPSGTSGGLENGSFANLSIISNELQSLVDGSYTVPSTSTSTSGTPSIDFAISVSGGLVDTIVQDTLYTTGYAIGDTFTIQGSDLGGTGTLVVKIISLDIDGLLIVIGGDFYEVKWNNLIVGGTSPTSLSDAQQLLATLFSTL